MKMLFVCAAIAAMAIFLIGRETQCYQLRFRVHADGTVFVVQNGNLLCTF